MWFNRRRDPRVRDEVQFHRDRLVEDYIAAGMSRADAERRAFLEFGNVGAIEERVKDARGRWIEDFGRDIGYALRTLGRNRAFAIAAVLSLALGIGANVAIFTLIDAVLLRPLSGVADPQRLVRLEGGSVSYAKFEALKTRGVLDHIAAFSDDRFAAEIDGALQWTRVLMVSGEFFDALKVSPMLGRMISIEDERTEAPVAVLSHNFWSRAFSADRSVLGKSFVVGRSRVTIVGVVPANFRGVHVDIATDVIVPVTTVPRLRPEQADILSRRSAHWLRIIGRVPPDQSLEQANARFQAAWPQVLVEAAPAGLSPDSGYFRQTAALASAANGFSLLRSTYSSPLFVLLALVTLVLLTACANVASLLLARGAARDREFAVRLSIGASRGRLIRQLVTENLLLAALAGAFGLAFAFWSMHLLVGFISPAANPVSLDLRPDARMLGFTIAVTLLTAAACGLVPALRTTQVDLGRSLKARAVSSASVRLRQVLVASQVAVAMVLAVGAGLFLSSFRHLLVANLGFEPTNVVLVRANAVGAGHRGPPAPAFFQTLLERARSTPGVQAAGLSWAPPVSQGFGNNGTIAIAGRADRPGEDRVVWSNFVSSGYLETIRQRLVAGRGFTDRDRSGTPRVAIVNQSLARYFFGDEDPVGHFIAPWDGTTVQPDCEIVGVVEDAVHFDLKEPPKRVLYVPFEQGPGFLDRENLILAVRSTLPPVQVAASMRDVVGQIDRNVLVETETLQTHVEASFARERLLAVLSGFLGTLSLLLVAVGLYGVMAYSVACRTTEIGIRLALGAQPMTVLAMVLSEGVRILLIGGVIGVIAAFAVSRAVAGLLFGISSSSAVAFGGAAGVMAAVALAATLIPAHRASQVAPTVALRYE
jgi:predicted permease